MTTPPACQCEDLKNCRTCYQRDWRRRNREKVLASKRKWGLSRDRSGDPRSIEYSRRYRAENYDKVVEANRRRHLADPRKERARKAVDREIRAGRLVKQPCERCGSTNRIHAHHDNYDKQLEVRWLCAKHHAERHRQLGW